MDAAKTQDIVYINSANDDIEFINRAMFIARRNVDLGIMETEKTFQKYHSLLYRGNISRNDIINKINDISIEMINEAHSA